MNGDSYTDGDLHAFAEDYRAAKADMSVLVVPADGRLDCGLVSVDSSRKVLGFKEKQTSAGTFHINAGIYIATKQLLHDVPPGLRLSLEEELFPRWLAEGKYIRAFSHAGCCVDIGTPERYQSAQEMLANVEIGETFSYPQSKRAQSHGYQDRDEPCEPEENRNFGTTMKAQQNTKQLHNLIRTRIERAIEIKSVLLADSGYHVLVATVAMQIVKSLGAGGKVLFFWKWRQRCRRTASRRGIYRPLPERAARAAGNSAAHQHLLSDGHWQRLRLRLHIRTTARSAGQSR
jgi:NDP-sugar pyrophosphorylase family protein